MKIGAMNHPARPLVREIEDIHSMGFDFIDLTLEPPCAAWWKIDVDEVRDAIEQCGIGIVGHTAYYLPIASTFERVRAGAICELKSCIDVFSRLEADCMNVHPDWNTPFHTHEYMIENNLHSLRELIQYADERGIQLMLENLPAAFNNGVELAELLDPLPALGLHLDVGHANLYPLRNTTEEILDAFGSRLEHVHLHDNRGGAHDLHLPLGSGTLPWISMLHLLKSHGYDGSITLEVFSEDRHYLKYSMERVREEWKKA